MNKILVIDDDPNDRLVIRKILTSQKNQFEVIEAKNGEMGIELALEILPDLILCDVIMPNINGYDVLNQIRSNKSSEAIPFIFLTAKTDISDLRKGMNLGADDYLVKPFDAQNLIDAVTTRLKRFNSMKEVYTNELKQSAEQLNNQLNHDKLTNLPNRFSLREQFNQILEKSYKESTQVVPIITLKLDRFEKIVNNYGYQISDDLLKKIAKRLLNLIGNDNTIAHINSDEFVIILTPLKEQNIIKTIVEAIATELSQVFIINKEEIFIHSHIGIALYPKQGKNLEKLLQNSQIALSQINSSNEHKYNFYSPVIDLKTKEQNIIEQDLYHVLEKNELQVYYQAQFNLKINKMTAGEALLRWYHPKLSSISPTQFLPIAEEIGLIEPISEWLLNRVCQDTKYLHQQGFEYLNIAVNLSGKQFNRIDFNKKLMQKLIENDLNASSLNLEIKEDLLVQNDPISIGRLNALHDIGVKIALDDFGTGYSSLSYLQSFPIDIIKIDPCLIRNIDKNPKNLTITEAVINLAHKLNLEVVAEGVETQGEFDCLKDLNCDLIQGYYLSVPLSFSHFVKFFKNYNNISS